MIGAGCIAASLAYGSGLDLTSGAFIDFNGDRRGDFGAFYNQADHTLAQAMSIDLSRGSGFTNRLWPAATARHIQNGGTQHRYTTLIGDFNGDRRSDLVTISPDGGGGWASWASMDFSLGSRFGSLVWSCKTPMHMRNGGAHNNYLTFAGDFNGDGRSDLATVSPDGGGSWSHWYAMEISTGTGFSSSVWPSYLPLHMRNGGAKNEYRPLIGDFNGDGRSDIATISPNAGGAWVNHIHLDISYGAGFTSCFAQSITPANMRYNPSRTKKTFFHLVGDFNGDGRSDIATISPDADGGWGQWIAMDLSTGTGFSSTVWHCPTPAHMRNGGLAGTYYVPVVGDFNGDGRDDIATVSPNGGGGWAHWYAIELSTGYSFSSTVWASNTPMHMRNGNASSAYQVLAQDFTGDGRCDIAVLSQNALGAWGNWYAMDISAGNRIVSTVWGSATPARLRLSPLLSAPAHSVIAGSSTPLNVIHDRVLLDFGNGLRVESSYYENTLSRNEFLWVGNNYTVRYALPVRHTASGAIDGWLVYYVWGNRRQWVFFKRELGVTRDRIYSLLAVMNQSYFDVERFVTTYVNKGHMWRIGDRVEIMQFGAGQIVLAPGVSRVIRDNVRLPASITPNTSTIVMSNHRSNLAIENRAVHFGGMALPYSHMDLYMHGTPVFGIGAAGSTPLTIASSRYGQYLGVRVNMHEVGVLVAGPVFRPEVNEVITGSYGPMRFSTSGSVGANIGGIEGRYNHLKKQWEFGVGVSGGLGGYGRAGARGFVNPETSGLIITGGIGLGSGVGSAGAGITRGVELRIDLWEFE